MAHKNIGTTPKIEAQYVSLFNLIKDFESSDKIPRLTSENLVRYIRTHPELHINSPHDKLVNAKAWDFVEEKYGTIYLTNKAHEYLQQRNGDDLTDLLNS